MRELQNDNVDLVREFKKFTYTLAVQQVRLLHGRIPYDCC